MHKIVIEKNKHYPFPYFFTCLPKWISKNKECSREYEYMFTNSCLYDLHNVDEYDVNKLFGFSIGWHHITSFRFGWRPLLDVGKIEIDIYEYHDGIRQTTIPITAIDINKWYKYVLVYSPTLCTTYTITSDDGNTVENKVSFTLKKSYGLGYTLGTYFGGNEKAPHNIIIYQEKRIVPE